MKENPAGRCLQIGHSRRLQNSFVQIELKIYFKGSFKGFKASSSSWDFSATTFLEVERDKFPLFLQNELKLYLRLEFYFRSATWTILKKLSKNIFTNMNDRKIVQHVVRFVCCTIGNFRTFGVYFSTWDFPCWESQLDPWVLKFRHFLKLFHRGSHYYYHQAYRHLHRSFYCLFICSLKDNNLALCVEIDETPIFSKIEIWKNQRLNSTAPGLFG